jgi:Holliday junction resolvase RusA-like endonuclease
MIEFVIFGEAQPQGSMQPFTPKGWTRPILTSSNPKLKSWRQLVAERANLALSKVPATERVLLTAGVRLSIAFYLPRPHSLPKKRTAHITKPDLDKLIRAVCDALSQVLFEDDRQVCELVATKQYAAFAQAPYVRIRVEPTAGVERVTMPTLPLFASVVANVALPR